MKRRDFIRTAVAGAAVTGITGPFAGCSSERTFNINRLGRAGGMKFSYEPYELQLRHVFTVSSYSRKTAP